MSTMWLLDQESRQELESFTHNSPAPSASELAEYEATFDVVDGMPRIMSIIGTEALINVTGVLTGRPNWYAQFFGGGNTTYNEIIAAAKLIDSDPNIQSAIMHVDSGGGEASTAWLAAMEAVAAIEKPVIAHVGNMAASAAFGIASQANEIFAENALSKVGSVGVVTTFSRLTSCCFSSRSMSPVIAGTTCTVRSAISTQGIGLPSPRRIRRTLY